MATTEVILKQKSDAGVEGQTVRVKAGYARYLFLKDLAIPATAGNKRMVAKLEQARAEREGAELVAAQEQAGKLGKLTLTFELIANPGQEKVFGSVTSQDIANKLQEHGHTVDRKKIQLAQPIKQTGEHTVTLALGHGVEATVKVKVSIPAEEKSDAADTKGKGKKPRKEAQSEQAPEATAEASE